MLPAWLDRLSEGWWSLHPRTRVACLSVAVVTIVFGAGARGLADPYGPERSVWVATQDLPSGAALDGHDGLRRTAVPTQLLPDQPATTPTGRLAGPLPAGVILADGHLARGGVGELAGPGRAAVPVPPDALPPVAVGDRLQLIVAEGDGTGRIVADRADVLAHEPEAVWLGVDADASVDVAAGGTRGVLTATVLPP